MLMTYLYRFVLNISDKLDLNVELTTSVRKSLAEKEAKLYVIDATQIAIDLKLPGRINMHMQTVFFGLANIIEPARCIELLKKSIAKQYARKGKDVIQKNWDMVDHALAGLKEVKYDRQAWLNATEPAQPEKKGIMKLLDMTIKQLADEVTVEEVPEGSSRPQNNQSKGQRNQAIPVPPSNHITQLRMPRCMRPSLPNSSTQDGQEKPQARKKTKNYKRNLIHSQVSNISLNNVIDLSKRKTIKDLLQ